VKVEAESTDEVIVLSGGKCRLWKGTTAAGVPCFLAVRTIAVPARADLSEFEQDLRVNPDPPSIDAELTRAGARSIDHDLHVIDSRMFR
jgi:hypothetical protein